MIGPFGYVGGKRRLAARIARLIPEHITYVEPFCGGAQVFFRKVPSRVEVLNDLSGDVITFLRVCQHHPAELVRVMRYWIASRHLFEAFLSQDVRHLTDIQRAARFLYLQKNVFGGRVSHQTFHYAVMKPSNYDPGRLPALIEAVADRLVRVQLEQRPYEDVIRQYDRPTTFFYLDPPYVGLSWYQFNFAEADYTSLADRLSNVGGKFLLSLNDCEFARRTFGRFLIHCIGVPYTASRLVPTGRELLISNYNLPDAPSLSGILPAERPTDVP